LTASASTNTFGADDGTAGWDPNDPDGALNHRTGGKKRRPGTIRAYNLARKIEASGFVKRLYEK
jgi:hypothetical protein